MSINPNDPHAPQPATYRSSDNVPSVRTLAPVPRFPVIEGQPTDQEPPAPDSAQSPSTLTRDHQGQTLGTGPAATLHLQTRQIKPSTLQVPTVFDPKQGKHVPVVPPVKDESAPVTALPAHRPLTGGV
jgi:hypothetical protein